MTPWLDDGDVVLYLGDALETVRAMPDESVDCVVTSPPYWGLRDYGTGSWDGGDPDCDHRVREDARVESSTLGGGKSTTGHQREGFKDGCPRCGARRVDQQMGLEPTPDLFVAGMVEMFREIRRVLAPHGTCWVNLGDSYAGAPVGSFNGGGFKDGANRAFTGHKTSGTLDKLAGSGLKPKDLVGIPWRVAFALQADGWWLRSDIIWAKPNPMPESATDRPTKSHEYLFLLTKAPRYWFDAEAVREKSLRAGDIPGGDNGRGVGEFGVAPHAPFNGPVPANRNVRSVWTIATQPYPEAHFATYPEELARRCILAGCPAKVCTECGLAWERGEDGHWKDCHGLLNFRSGVVLDPFIGSGTTAKVARDHQRHAIGIDLNREYLELAARRLQQLSLLT